MKKVRKNLQTDLSFILLLVLMFVYFIFLIYQEEYLLDNFLIATVVFLIVLVTYFTNLTTGLIINTTLILGYITYVIVQSMTKGTIIRPYVYFWVGMAPALTTAFSLFTMSTARLQSEVNSLGDKLVATSTLNEETKLKNLRAFENDANIYMSIARRYDIDFGVLVIRFKYQREIESLSRREGMHKVIMQVVDAVRKATRAEDELYQLDEDQITFALLMLTKKESGTIVQDRIKERIAQIDTNEILNTRQLILDMRLGMAFATDGKGALDILGAARDAMQYDV
ncbi:MAG: diguanylate cyclase [Eubacteriales bacterium]|nr:diguanylate cyclase [Eubacteriales bacterium]